MKLGGYVFMFMYIVVKNFNGEINIGRIGFCFLNVKLEIVWFVFYEIVFRSFLKVISGLRSFLKENYINMWEWCGRYIFLFKSC